MAFEFSGAKYSDAEFSAAGFVDFNAEKDKKYGLLITQVVSSERLNFGAAVAARPQQLRLHAEGAFMAGESTSIVFGAAQVLSPGVQETTFSADIQREIFDKATKKSVSRFRMGIEFTAHGDKSQSIIIGGRGER